MDGIYRESREADWDDEDEEDAPWMNIYYVKIETKAGERIGQFGYRVIDSAARRADPYEVAGNQVLQYCNLALNLKLSERGGSWLESFGRTLWNNNPPHDLRDGGLKAEFISGDRRGTGVFGTELNNGPLAVFSHDTTYAKDDLFIREEYRGRGIGTWVMNQLFAHETMRGVRFVFAAPWATRMDHPDTEPTAAEAANTGVELFFRKIGFRRVGQSEYFAYALADRNHPSHKLAIEDDVGFKESTAPFNIRDFW